MAPPRSRRSTAGCCPPSEPSLARSCRGGQLRASARRSAHQGPTWGSIRARGARGRCEEACKRAYAHLPRGCTMRGIRGSHPHESHPPQSPALTTAPCSSPTCGACGSAPPHSAAARHYPPPLGSGHPRGIASPAPIPSGPRLVFTLCVYVQAVGQPPFRPRRRREQAGQHACRGM